jgi:type I restriction enzyme M protein
MMNLCDIHTILRLPTGIFYSQGVKTNVVFLTRGETDRGSTKSIWLYDLRNQMVAFGKTRPLKVGDFAEFEKAFGTDPLGRAKRKDQGEEGRFRCFKRDEIRARNDTLDIGWFHSTEVEAEEHLTDPEDIAAAIVTHLKAALEEIEELSDEFGGAKSIEPLESEETTA